MIESYWTCIKYNIILFFKTISQVSKLLTYETFQYTFLHSHQNYIIILILCHSLNLEERNLLTDLN